MIAISGLGQHPGNSSLPFLFNFLSNFLVLTTPFINSTHEEIFGIVVILLVVFFEASGLNGSWKMLCDGGIVKKKPNSTPVGHTRVRVYSLSLSHTLSHFMTFLPSVVDDKWSIGFPFIPIEHSLTNEVRMEA